MFAIKGHRRLTVVALAVMLLGVFLLPIPFAASQSAGGSQAGQVQRFLILITRLSDANPTVLGFGPVHAKGVDKTVNRHTDVFVFPKGKLFVRHHATGRHNSHDPKTCLSRSSERGVYRITRGTGAYAGAHGHGRYHTTSTFIGCEQGPPDAAVVRITARGPLHF